MTYARSTTLNPNPGGDTTKDAIVNKVDVDLTNAFSYLNAHASSTNAHGITGYAVGDWTPGISFNGGSIGITYSSAHGKYTKIGNKVFLSGDVTLTNKGSSNGNLLITGLPFTANGYLGAQGIFHIIPSYCNLTSDNIYGTCNGGNFIQVAGWADGTSVGPVTDAMLQNNSAFYLNGWIEV